MNNYTIHCTPEQTKKALELGAPITIKYGSIKHKPSIEELNYLLQYEDMWYKIPTSEEMIGWMEEHHPIDHIDIYKQITTWRYCVYLSTLERISGKGNSRKEATLAAIDAALNYLINNKSK